MDSAAALRLALVAEFLLGAISIVFSYALQDTLPAPLAEWLSQEAERDPTAGETILVLALLPPILGYFVSMVGLFLLQRWARWVYLVVTIALVPAALLLGPTVQSSLEATTEDLSAAMSGIVIGIAFFGDVFPNAAETAW